LEAGDLQGSPKSQEHYEGEITGLDYYPLDTCRLRFFGGTSNHWAGETRPLDAHDFEPLPYDPLRQWPIKKSDLDPYAIETDAILDLPPARAPLDIFGGKDDSLQPTTLRLSPPTRFGEKYKEELSASGKISLCLNANLIDIELDPSLRQVTGLVLRSYGRDEPFKVRGRYVAICLGAIENPRMLLNASRQLPQGIGNEHDLVGRFFAEHPSTKAGSAILTSLPSERVIYAPTARLLAENRSQNFMAQIEPRVRTSMQHVVDVALCSTSLMHRVGEAVLGRARDCSDAEVWVGIAQSGNRDSRVKLSEKLDTFGLRRPALDWRLTELDYHSLRTAALQIAERMARHDVGRLQLAPWLREPMTSLPDKKPEISGAYHQMCTTRMSDDATTGVVDRNSRVHDLENLYVGGSSVFASSGVSNPTYTIVQLTLRLADHLDTRLRAA
jgi:choline dehydrogenase-like flavoprotein